MPGHRLHIQQIPLILRPTLHRKIIPNQEDQQVEPRGLFSGLLVADGGGLEKRLTGVPPRRALVALTTLIAALAWAYAMGARRLGSPTESGPIRWLASVRGPYADHPGRARQKPHLRPPARKVPAGSGRALLNVLTLVLAVLVGACRTGRRRPGSCHGCCQVSGPRACPHSCRAFRRWTRVKAARAASRRVRWVSALTRGRRRQGRSADGRACPEVSRRTLLAWAGISVSISVGTAVVRR
jgi:hypothetical protein